MTKPTNQKARSSTETPVVSPQIPAKIARTGEGLRDLLFDELDHLRTPDGNPRRAAAVANLSQQILRVVEVEIKYARHTANGDGTNHQVPTLRLGSGQ